MGANDAVWLKPDREDLRRDILIAEMRKRQERERQEFDRRFEAVLSEITSASSNGSSSHVDLSWEHLHRLTSIQWRAFGQTLSAKAARSLSLRSASLDSFDREQFGTFFRALAGSRVTLLHLCQNNLNKLTAVQWDAFAQALETSKVTSVSLRGSDLFSENFEIQHFANILSRLPYRAALLLSFSLIDANAHHRMFTEEELKAFLSTSLRGLTESVSIPWEINLRDGRVYWTIKPQGLTDESQEITPFLNGITLLRMRPFDGVVIPSSIDVMFDFSAFQLTPWDNLLFDHAVKYKSEQLIIRPCKPCDAPLLEAIYTEAEATNPQDPFPQLVAAILKSALSLKSKNEAYIGIQKIAAVLKKIVWEDRDLVQCIDNILTEGRPQAVTFVTAPPSSRVREGSPEFSTVPHLGDPSQTRDDVVGAQLLTFKHTMASLLLLNLFQAYYPLDWNKALFSLSRQAMLVFLAQLEKHLFCRTPLTSTVLQWLIYQSQLPAGLFKLDKNLYTACIKALRDNKPLPVTLTQGEEADPKVVSIQDLRELLRGNTSLFLDYAGKFERASPSRQIWLRLAAESSEDSQTACDASYQLGVDLLDRKEDKRNVESALSPYYWFRRVASAHPGAKHQLTLALPHVFKLSIIGRYQVAMWNVPRGSEPTVYARAFEQLLLPGDRNYFGQFVYYDKAETREFNRKMLSFLQSDTLLEEEKKYSVLRAIKGHDISKLMQDTPLADWYDGLARYAGKNLYRFMKEQILSPLQQKTIKQSVYSKLKKQEESQGFASLNEQQRMNLFAYEAVEMLKSYDTSQGCTLFGKVISAETPPLIVYHQIKTSLTIGLARYQLEESDLAKGLNEAFNAHKQTLLQSSTIPQDSPVTCFAKTLHKRLSDYWACASVVEMADIPLKVFNSDVEQGKRSQTAGYQALAIAKKTFYGVAVVGELVSLVLPYTKLFAELCSASAQVCNWIKYLHDNERMFFAGPAKGLHIWHFISYLIAKGDPTERLQELQTKALADYREIFGCLHADDSDVFQVCAQHYIKRYQPLLNELTPQSADLLAKVLADLLFRGLMHKHLDSVVVDPIKNIFSPIVGSNEYESLFERLDQVIWQSGILPDEAYLIKRSGEVISVQQALFDVSLRVDGKPHSIALYAQDEKSPHKHVVHKHARHASAYELKCLEKALKEEERSPEGDAQAKQVGLQLQLSEKTRADLKGKKLSVQPSDASSLRQLYYRTEWRLGNVERTLFQHSSKMETLSWVLQLENYSAQFSRLVGSARHLQMQLRREGFPGGKWDLEGELVACIKESGGLAEELSRRAAKENSSQIDRKRDLTQPHRLDVPLPGIGELVSIEQVKERLQHIKGRLLGLCRSAGLPIEEYFPGHEKDMPTEVVERRASSAVCAFFQGQTAVAGQQKTQAATSAASSKYAFQ